MRKRPVLAALAAQREATLARLAAVDEAGWEAPCGTEGRVRDVAARLIAVDAAAASGKLVLASRAPGLPQWHAYQRRQAAAWADATGDELRRALVHQGARLRKRLRRTPSLVVQLHVTTPFGRHPLLYLAYRRVLDEWYAEQDLAATLDQQPPQVGTALAPVLITAILEALPTLVLPQVGRSVGVLRLVVEHAPASEQRRIWGIDFARRHYGPRVTALPDATLWLDVTTLALVADRRETWTSVAPDRLRVIGDDALAGAFLDGLAGAPTGR